MQTLDTPAARENRAAMTARGGAWATGKRQAEGREVGPLALLDNDQLSMWQGLTAGGYETAPVAGARAYIAAAGRRAGLSIGGVVPVGPIGVGAVGNLGRSEVYVVVEHDDNRLPWRVQYSGGDARKAVRLVDLINQAANAARGAGLS